MTVKDNILTAARRWKRYPAYKNSGVEWLGEIPKHWKVSRLRWYLSLRSGDYISNDEFTIEPDEERPYSVIGGNGVMGYTNKHNVYDQSIAIGRVGAKCGNVHLISDKVWITDNALFITSWRGFRLGYLALLLQSLNLNNKASQNAQPLITGSLVKDEICALPPVNEQDRIIESCTKYLTQIDALIAKMERLIELLQEKRTALISHAVTKGLDPNVPMKDSGVEWIGKIPAHWSDLHLRRVIDKFVDYRGATPEKVPFGIPLITAKNIKNGTIDLNLSQEFIREEDYDGWMVRGLPEVGDVLVTTEAPLGESAQILDTNIALAQRIILLKANKSLITNDYIKYHFASDSGRGELWSRATGSTAIGIKASHLKGTYITVPPLIEQKAITQYIDCEVAKIGTLIEKVKQAREKLKEYRIALISAAVTGKIDVREETL